MSALEINFIERPRKLTALAAVVAALGACALIGVSFLMYQADSERTGLISEQQRLVSAEKKKGTSQVAKSAALAATASADKAMQIRTALGQPWTKVLDAVALSARDASVGMVSLDAQTTSRTVVITAESKDLAGALRWVHLLRGNSLIQSAALNSHEVRSDGGGPHIRFAVELVWRAPQ